MDRIKQFESSAQLQLDLGGGHRFMKIILLGFNVLFFIFGCILCGVGAYALNSSTQILIGNTLPQGIIACGCFLMFMSILGGISAWKEWRIGLGLFFVLLLLLSIILIAVGIAVYVKRDDAGKLMAEAWCDRDIATVGIKNTLQQEFNCYGGVSEVPFSPHWKGNYGNVGCFEPGTVPAGYKTEKGENDTILVNPYTNPYCVPVLEDGFNSAFTTAGGTGIGFAVVMLICLAFVCFLMRGIKNKDLNRDLARTRARNERDMDKKRMAGKTGMKLPGDVL